MDNFTTRKILSGLVLLVVALIVTYLKGDIPTNLMSFLQVLYGSFVIGNSIQHFTEMKATQNNKENS